jgi:hypothetical protein
MTKAYMTVEWKAHMLDSKKAVKTAGQTALYLVAHLVVEMDVYLVNGLVVSMAVMKGSD